MNSSSQFKISNFKNETFIKKCLKRSTHTIDLVGVELTNQQKDNECAICLQFKWDNSVVCLQCD